MVQSNLLKAKIVASQISRKELAKRANISESTLSAKINGKRSFTLDEVEILCETLNINADSEKCEIFLHKASQN